MVWEHSSKVTFSAGEALHVRAGMGPKVTLPAPSFYSQDTGALRGCDSSKVTEKRWQGCRGEWVLLPRREPLLRGL